MDRSSQTVTESIDGSSLLRDSPEKADCNESKRSLKDLQTRCGAATNPHGQLALYKSHPDVPLDLAPGWHNVSFALLWGEYDDYLDMFPSKPVDSHGAHPSLMHQMPLKPPTTEASVRERAKLLGLRSC